MKYPRRVQVQGQRVLVKNPQEERELLERSKSQTSDEAKLANALGDKNLGLLITRKTKRIDNRLAGPSLKMRTDSWQKKLLDDDELFLLL